MVLLFIGDHQHDCNCKKYFPTKKLRDKHRVKCHPRQTGDENKEGDADEVKEDEVLNEREQEYYAKVERICDERDGQYLSVMSDGSHMFVTLDVDDERVAKCLQERSNVEDDGKIPIIKDVREWNLCPWVPQEKYQNNDSNK